VGNLNVSGRNGCPCSHATPRAAVALQTPSCAASNRDDQGVTPSFFGGGFSVAATISR
jgi:hypothetical protein